MAAIASPCCWARAGSRQRPIQNTRARRMLACGLYRASRDQSERSSRILVERRHCPLLVIQGLDDEAAPPGNGHALREQLGERVRLVDLPRAGHFLLLEQPEAYRLCPVASLVPNAQLDTAMIRRPRSQAAALLKRAG